MLSQALLIRYALIAIPLAMLGLPLYIYLPTFYADSVGLSVATVGIVLFVSRLSDVITDPLIGSWSDKVGSRKPFMLIGAILLIVSYYALIHPPESYIELWLLLSSMLVYLGWSFVSIPYLAWSAELSFEYHDKTRLSVYREIATILGVMLALVLPTFFGVAADAQQTLVLLYIVFVLLIILLLPFTLKIAPQISLHVSTPMRLSMLVLIYKQHKGLGRLQSAFIINALANALPATLFLLYVDLVLDAAAMSGKLLLVYFVAGVIGLPFWTGLSHRISKRRAWMASMLLSSVAFLFVLGLDKGDVLAFAVISFISGLSLGADMALPASIQADIAQKLEKSHQNISGFLFGLWAMLTKFALALAVGISFGILGIVGFESSAPTPLTLLVLTLLYSTLPVVFKVMSLVLMHYYREANELT
jgi:Na+/melibiose symporter-like transporter